MSSRVRDMTRVMFAALVSITVIASLATPAGALEDSVVTNTATSDQLVVLGRGRIAESGPLSAALYRGKWWHEPWVLVRDSLTGETRHVRLPVPQVSSNEWWNATPAWVGDDLWVLAGDGPVLLRRYRLSGSPLPDQAQLVETHVMGTSDSRAGDLTALNGGGVAGVWSQQGFTGPQGLQFVRAVPGSVTTLGPVQFMPTMSSVQSIAQHPADDSVWVFHAPDAFGSTGAARLIDHGTELGLDWTDPYFFSSADGDHGSDPENPFVVAVPDPSTATIAVAYQGRKRQIFSTSPTVIGSQPVVARVSADRSRSFLALPVYVERISQLGLAVRSGETWLSHRPIQPDMSFDQIELAVHRAGVWQPPVLFGELESPYGYVAAAASRPEFMARLSDSQLHLRSELAGGAPDDSGGSGGDTTSTKGKGGGKGGGGGGGSSGGGGGKGRK